MKLDFVPQCLNFKCVFDKIGCFYSILTYSATFILHCSMVRLHPISLFRDDVSVCTPMIQLLPSIYSVLYSYSTTLRWFDYKTIVHDTAVITLLNSLHQERTICLSITRCIIAKKLSEIDQPE